MQLDPDAQELLRLSLHNFAALHRQNEHQARIYMLAFFAGGFSLMDLENRMRVLSTMQILVQDIDREIFEDPADFISFLAERIKEKLKRNAGECNG